MGRRVRVEFPCGVEAPAQYGPHFRGFMLYFSNEQILPFDRLRKTCADLFSQKLSLGTLTSTNTRAYEALAPVESTIIAGILAPPAVHVQRRRPLRLQFLQQALEMMDGGTHGFCADCRREIEYERLDAQPETLICGPCTTRPASGND